MRRAVFRGVGAIVVAGGWASASMPAAAFTVPVPAPPALSIDAPGGPYMTDQYGRVLQLHGFNLVAKCPSFSRNTTVVGSPCVPGPNLPGQPSYWLSPDPSYATIDPDRTFTDADAAKLAAMGFNFARVGIIWRGLEPGKPGHDQANMPEFCGAHLSGAFTPPGAATDPYDAATIDAYLQHIDDEVNLLAAHGIYSLIDMHQDDYSEFFNNPGGATPWEGEGAPLWATCTTTLGIPAPDISSSLPAWNVAPFSNLALAVAADHFWNNDVAGNLQGQFIKVWQRVAAHYSSNHWIAGYDPFNEPYDSFYTPTTVFDRKLECFYAGKVKGAASCALTVPPSQTPQVGIIPAVQSVDPNHLVFYETPISTDFSAPQTVGGLVFSLPFPKLVLNFHIYGLVGTGLGGGECNTPDCSLQEDLTMEQFLLSRALTTTSQGSGPGKGPALLVSEFGAENSASDIGHVAQIADGQTLPGGIPVSWTYWAGRQNHDPTGSPHEDLFDVNRQEVQPKGCVLTRAYARATAGTPQSQIMNTVTSAFEYAYTPNLALDAAGHHTEVVLPQARYSGGYQVSVTGGTYSVAAGLGGMPDVLTVSSTSAGTVTVHVTPMHQACSVDTTSAPSGGSGAGGSVAGANQVAAAGALPTTSSLSGSLPAAATQSGAAAVGILLAVGLMTLVSLRRRARLTSRRMDQ